MLGAVIVLVILFIAGPIAVFIGGAAWSALFGLLESDHADHAHDADS